MHSFRNCTRFQSIFCPCIVQPEYVIQHIKASLRCWHQMEYLAEVERVLFIGKLITEDKTSMPQAGPEGW